MLLHQRPENGGSRQHVRQRGTTGVYLDMDLQYYVSELRQSLRVGGVHRKGVTTEVGDEDAGLQGSFI